MTKLDDDTMIKLYDFLKVLIVNVEEKIFDKNISQSKNVIDFNLMKKGEVPF